MGTFPGQGIFENQLLLNFLNFVSVLVPLKDEKNIQATVTRQDFSTSSVQEFCSKFLTSQPLRPVYMGVPFSDLFTVRRYNLQR